MKVAQVIDAIEKNGYKQIQGSYINFDGVIKDRNHVTGACAIGQAALNLGINWTKVHDALANIKIGYYSLAAYIENLNDSAYLDCKEIAQNVRDYLPSVLDIDVPLEEGTAYAPHEGI